MCNKSSNVFPLIDVFLNIHTVVLYVTTDRIIRDIKKADKQFLFVTVFNSLQVKAIVFLL